jgi:hypothetical protein
MPIAAKKYEDAILTRLADFDEEIQFMAGEVAKRENITLREATDACEVLVQEGKLQRLILWSRPFDLAAALADKSLLPPLHIIYVKAHNSDVKDNVASLAKAPRE